LIAPTTPSCGSLPACRRASLRSPGRGLAVRARWGTPCGSMSVRFRGLFGHHETVGDRIPARTARSSPRPKDAGLDAQEQGTKTILAVHQNPRFPTWRLGGLVLRTMSPRPPCRGSAACGRVRTKAMPTHPPRRSRPSFGVSCSELPRYYFSEIVITHSAEWTLYCESPSKRRGLPRVPTVTALPLRPAQPGAGRVLAGQNVA